MLRFFIYNTNKRGKEENTMMIEAKVQKTFDTGSVKAICDVTLDGAFAIHGVKLIEGEKGRFVSMPADKWKNSQGETQHKDIVHPLNAEIRKELFSAVEKAYDSNVQGISENDQLFGMK